MLLVLGLWVDLFTKALAFDKFDLFRRFGAGLISDVSEGAYVPEPAKRVCLAYVWAIAHSGKGGMWSCT